MGAENKAANKVTEIKGKIKKEAGKATDDAYLEAEGRAERRRATLSRLARKSRTPSRSNQTHSRLAHHGERKSQCISGLAP